MCGVACYLGRNQNYGQEFVRQAKPLLVHRGPDDSGVFFGENVALLHLRLSILDLTQSGHQPMASANGRYKIVFNGEIYNHLELRKRYLSSHRFIGHSDTETILELFCLMQERMLPELVGMWAIIIFDVETGKVFVSRDRYGQKPLYTRRDQAGAWTLCSEIAPLLKGNQHNEFNSTSVAEYLALGTYGHLGINTFFKGIEHFPQGCYTWLGLDDKEISATPYWTLPDIDLRDKIPFDKSVQKKLKDLIVEAVVSQTISDVPIGITLSGGIDSSIIAGILATYCDRDIHVFTAQLTNSKFDESKYVDAVIKKWNRPNLIVHRRNLHELSVKNDLLKYIKIQEEPFGDTSIIGHGSLMEMAAAHNIKVILNGQGADELFFGYNNMAQTILMRQLAVFKFGDFARNIKALNLGKAFLARAVLQAVAPGLVFKMRIKSHKERRKHINADILANVDETMIKNYSYEKFYDVWSESIYGVHLPHLMHYDDRNGMASSVEGRCPFLDHRIADFVATIRPEAFLKNGLRKFILRESCREYLPDEVYNRTDKIGFHTPLVDALNRDKEWVLKYFENINLVDKGFVAGLQRSLMAGNLDTPNALHIWRLLSVYIWMDEFKVSREVLV